MIQVESVTKRFGDNLAVDRVTLEVQRGEVFGLLGPNGAGKTTMVRVLTCLIAPTSGAAWVNGYQVGVDDPAIRASVGLLTESPGLYSRLNAEENLRIYARLYEVPDEDARVAKYLDLVDLWERRSDPVGTFSKGMQQRLAIARALLHEPPVLFLDEPTSALDPEAARRIRDFIATLRGEGRTIVLCTHNLDEADRLCDRIGVMRQRLIRVDTPAALRRELYGQAVLIRLRETPPGLAAMVQALPFVTAVSPIEGGMRVVLDDPEAHNPALVRAIVEAGGEVLYVEREEQSLEQVYLDLMRESEEEEA
jgi:ABC-2 type transport system ATP-binding protein